MSFLHSALSKGPWSSSCVVCLPEPISRGQQCNADSWLLFLIAALEKRLLKQQGQTREVLVDKHTVMCIIQWKQICVYNPNVHNWPTYMPLRLLWWGKMNLLFSSEQRVVRGKKETNTFFSCWFRHFSRCSAPPDVIHYLWLPPKIFWASGKHASGANRHTCTFCQRH